MNVQTCFYEGDSISKSVAKYISKALKVEVKPHSSLNYNEPFIFLNGSNSYHHRTLSFIEPLSHVDGYVHIDNHDDIALFPKGSMKVGPASFVEFILARGKTVIFVGQNYWPYKVRFKGKSLTMLLRNNLCRYKPLSRVHFLRSDETYALCPLTTIKENISVIAEALEYSNIEKVFLLDECSEHVRLLKKPKKIELYHRSDLQWNWDSSFYSAFILKWSDFRLNMAPSEIYVSIDLDVLRPGIVECERSDVTSILTLEDVINAIEEIGKRSRIFAGDICGIYRYHKPTLNVIKTLYEKLREYIEGD
ncbi:MAG: hypothetical protein QXE14_03180 [Candidatus Bathyarchaeia archaeon]